MNSLKDTAALLFPCGKPYEGESATEALNDIEDIIAHKPGDPGKGYNLVERVRRVVTALEARRRW